MIRVSGKKYSRVSGVGGIGEEGRWVEIFNSMKERGVIEKLTFKLSFEEGEEGFENFVLFFRIRC